MAARMSNPAAWVIPGASEALQALNAATEGGGVPASTLALAHLRASQINGCNACIAGGCYMARQAGETDERLAAVAEWREAPAFTAAERAALALTEAATRLADREDPVPDAIWDEAARHYDERALATLLLTIALANFYNRLNVPTRQEAVNWGEAANWG
ncbi:MAG TPA: carboxymuconolactone decarboxylase family protein [Thermomicrobiales bacterium]|nr:carboxymuconolactone decarboxylase family protein [Thermomicrobiales bacterium]